jgi:hypothetical protein
MRYNFMPGQIFRNITLEKGATVEKLSTQTEMETFAPSRA